MTSDNVYERETLYKEVWSDPVTTVAKRYGVSDVAIHKACKRLQVPVPPRGYWAKLSAGQTIANMPLPPYDGPKTLLRRERNQPNTKPKVKEHLEFLNTKERTKVLELCSKLHVNDQLVNPHPLINQDIEARLEHERREQERKSFDFSKGNYEYDYDYWSNWQKKILDMKLQPNEMPRGYCLLNAIFHAVEKLGGSVGIDEKNGHTQIYWLGETMRIRLRSKENNFILMIDEYPAPRKNWQDTKTKQLENELGSFVIGILECAHAKQIWHEERRRQEECMWQQKITEREKQELKKNELERFQVLEENAFDWHKARVMEQYIADLEIQAHDKRNIRKRDEWLAYVAWAREKIAWFDPLVALEDPILGKRYDDGDEDEED